MAYPCHGARLWRRWPRPASRSPRLPREPTAKSSPWRQAVDEVEGFQARGTGKERPDGSDATCIATLLDRLLHDGDVTVIEGDSYRVRESQQRIPRPM